MCGIVGYIGSKRAYDILIQGLHRLEYRGYDSSGVAMISDAGELNIYKSKGKVEALEHFAQNKDLSGAIGIAHTRWATHGEPNDINAHPHYSQSGRIALVHNGTIENYTVLKEALTQHGYSFVSQTDTEVAVQLIEYIMLTNNCSLFDAVAEATKRIVGAYAIAVVDRQNPNQIIAARQSSPLVIGVGEGENFIASDIPAIINHTRRTFIMSDGEIATVTKDGVWVQDINGTIGWHPPRIFVRIGFALCVEGGINCRVHATIIAFGDGVVVLPECEPLRQVLIPMHRQGQLVDL